MSKTTNRIVTFIGYVVDFAPVLATVAIATYASFRATQSNAAEQELLQLILLILGLIATTQLIDKLRILRTIDAKLDKLVDSSQTGQGAANFFTYDFADLRERIRTAKSVAINGITLVRTSNTYFLDFKYCLANNGQVRILVIDPNHHVIETAAKRFNKHQDAEKLRRESEQALDNFESLLSAKGANKGFRLQTTSFVPAYGIWLIDADTPKAEIWVELYSFQGEQDPAFHLLPHRDGEWFTFFRNQFELMWNAGEPWHPQK